VTEHAELWNHYARSTPPLLMLPTSAERQHQAHIHSWEDSTSAIFKHNQRTMVREYRTHIALPFLFNFKFYSLFKFSITAAFISNYHSHFTLPMIRYSQSRHSTTMGWRVRAAPNDRDLTATHWVGSGIADWPPALCNIAPLPLSLIHHKAAGIGRSRFRGLEGLVHFEFQTRTLI